MPSVDVVDLTNKKVGEVELAEAVFGAKISEPLLHESVRHYLACNRAGTHKTKTRAEVSGSGRKPWKQKGTGRARAGSIRSPLWRTGGTVHGPQPRNYAYKLNKKMVLGALRSALTAKLADGAITVVEDFELASHKTKEFDAILDKLEAYGKVLLVNNGENRNLELSSRNVDGLTVIGSNDLHPYHLLGHKKILFSRATVEHCSEALR